MIFLGEGKIRGTVPLSFGLPLWAGLGLLMFVGLLGFSPNPVLAASCNQDCTDTSCDQGFCNSVNGQRLCDCSNDCGATGNDFNCPIGSNGTNLHCCSGVCQTNTCSGSGGGGNGGQVFAPT